MIFKELVKSVNIDDVIKYLNQDKNEEKFETSYRELYDSLLSREPKKEEDFILFVAELKDYFDDITIMDVLGHKKSDKINYALDFTPWEEWLAMEVAPKSVELYGEVCFVAECLREMSFISFDEQYIKNELKSLEEISERIKSGEEKTYTLEEMNEHFKEEFGWEFTSHERTEEEREEDLKRMDEIKKYNDTKISEILGE